MIASIILTRDNVYVSEDGKLPSRRGVDFDKELLTGLARGNTVSKKGYMMLPNSIKKEVHCDGRELTYPVTVPEIDAFADILLVVWSRELIRGKSFRFDNFELLKDQRDISIYKRIKS